MTDVSRDHLEWERLNEYADGRLDAADRRAAAAHLAACGECRDALGELRCLLAAASDAPESIDPPESLWQEIEATIDPRRQRTAAIVPAERGDRATWQRMGLSPAAEGGEPGPGSHRRLRRGRAWLAVAGLGLVVASSGTTVLLMRGAAGTEGTPAGGTATPSLPLRDAPSAVAGATLLPASLAAAEAGYLSDVEALQHLFDRQRAVLAPATIAIVERSLATIDAAIGEARFALLADPSNDELARFLDSNYRQKVELLRRAAELPQGS